MDVSEINKVSQRKKLNANAENLRDKINKENRNIVKLRVAQDTAYWDLKEQLRQVEGNHEKLQANMVEVQMQHEALSGQYQDELRLRPETLNKLSGTRQICDVLEDYSERLRGTLARCSADQAALRDAYHRSGHLVRDMKTHQLQAEEKTHQIVEHLNEKVKLTSENHSQLLQYFGLEKQRADAELVDVKARLEAAVAKKDELLAFCNELNRKMDQQKHDLQKKEEAIAGLESDIKELLHEFNIQGTDMKNTLVKQDKDLKEMTLANESLKQAVTNQESFTKSICDQNNQLQEKIAVLAEEQGVADTLIKDLRSQLEDATATNNHLKTELTTMTDNNEVLETEITNKTQLLQNAEADIQTLKLQLSVLETEKLEVADELNKAHVAADAMAVRVQELKSAVQAMEEKIVKTEANLNEYREAAECKINELTVTIEGKDKELDSNASTITQLMSEFKRETDARSKLDAALQRQKKEIEAERDAAGEKEKKFVKQVEQLEASVRNKESELSVQLNIILELRSDKERLHDKIQSMQNKIDNIQKELTGPPAAARAQLQRHLPEHDDNAVMLTPMANAPTRGNKLRKEEKKPTAPRTTTQRPFAMPFREKSADSMVSHLFSDSSMDGDNAIDVAEVNRRFEALARGEQLSPKPLSSLKRRRSTPAPGPASRASRANSTTERNDAVTPDVLQKNTDRMFFKKKRQDKPRKPKQASLF